MASIISNKFQDNLRVSVTLLILGIAPLFCTAQTYRSEAHKAMASIQNDTKKPDSIMQIFNGRWRLGFQYSQRFVNRSNLTNC